MKPYITESTIRQFVVDVTEQHYILSGAIIAVSAAQAAALGESCVQISLDNQIDKLDWHLVSQHIQQIAHIRNDLLMWCDHEASAIVEYTSLLNDNIIVSREPLYESCTKISELSINAAKLLKDFRPLVFADVLDDLEIAIGLLANMAKAAIVLLNKNLQQGSNQPTLQQKYKFIQNELERQINNLEVRNKM